MRNSRQRIYQALRYGLSAMLIFNLFMLPVLAAGHCKALLISMNRYADNTDTYTFRSVEPGHEGFVTIIANYIPFQETSGHSQFYRFDDNVLYEVKIDNTGDGVEDITYQFQFKTQTINPDTVFGMVTRNQNGMISSLNDPDYNQFQTYHGSAHT